MKIHCLARNPSLVSVMKKPWNPSSTARHPRRKTPSSFLLLFSPPLPPPRSILGSPTSPYISWDTLISRIQRLRAATRLAIQKARGTLFRQYLCPIVISPAEFWRERFSIFVKIKKNMLSSQTGCVRSITILRSEYISY